MALSRTATFVTTVAFAVVLTLGICAGFATSALAQSTVTEETTPSTESKSLNSKVGKSTTPSTASGGDKRVDKATRDNARRHYKAGVNYGRGGLYRQALQSFQRAIDYDPEFADAYYGLGHAYFDLGLYDEAVAAFQRVLKLNPNAVEAYAGLGQAYTKINQRKESLPPKDSTAAAEGVSLVAAGSEGRHPETDIDRERDQTRTYRVGVGDVLDIHMPGSVSDESTLFTISSNGLLEHPILGQPIKVLGLTTDEIGERFGAELKRRSIKETSPEIGVRDYNSHTILVSGLVKEPGTKILRREAIPLYVVLADAQPLSDAARVTVISQHAVKSRTVELSDPEQTSVLVQPGDVVTVLAPLKQFVYVGGDVKSPGELPFRPGITLTQAILSAGGTILKGDKVQLTRGRGNDLLNTREFKLKEINKGKIPDPLIEPGDRITVSP